MSPGRPLRSGLMARSEAEAEQDAGEGAEAVDAADPASPEGDGAAAEPEPEPAPLAKLTQSWTDAHHCDVEVRTDGAGAGSVLVGVRSKDVDTVKLHGGGMAAFRLAGDGATRVFVSNAAPETVVTVTVNMRTVKGLGR